MEKVLDLHIHSKYSRACSSKLELENIYQACLDRGVDIVATGDFTHPKWLQHISDSLEEIGKTGLYKLKNRDGRVKFILATELSLVYSDEKKCRRLHIMVQAPNLCAVKKLNDYLDKNYNIRSDGRPILGLPVQDLIKTCLAIDPKFLIYPAHIWTPWFAMFGSKSGFDSLEECFGDQLKHIYAYETGLSSDPEMNWRIKELDNLTLLSNSDAHSLQNIGREANVMDLDEETYDEIYEVIKNKDLRKIKYTLEFYPEEGMYHLDGHRDCHFSSSPEETKNLKGICPICHKPLVLGVSYRVEELANRPIGAKPKQAAGYKKLVELDKIIAESLNIKSRQSKAVQAEYSRLIKEFGNEFNILFRLDLEDLKKRLPKSIYDGVERARQGKLIIKPGFDGQYGEIRIFSNQEKGQIKLI
jgi:uncharacterized protein (TIGR00375 family)